MLLGAKTVNLVGSLKRDASSSYTHSSSSRSRFMSGKAKETTVDGDDNSHATVSLSDQDMYPASVGNFLHRTCLRPKWSVQNQLFVSFGLVSLISLVFIVVTAISTALYAGNSVKEISRENLRSWADEKIQLSSSFVADTIEQKLRNLESSASILVQLTQDRFTGYPNGNGYADDSAVPFIDHDTGVNMYPLNGTLLPLDWEPFPEPNNIFSSGLDRTDDLASEAHATMHFQGACDPGQVDTTSLTYYPGCTATNNDLETGGSVSPTDTFATIHSRASDFASATLKPIYEYHGDVQSAGLFFSNSGAGASVFFPARPLNGTASYVSDGCEWMLEPNPLDETRTIGTIEEIDRCHAQGTNVPVREYNPIERKWCQEQALNPDKAMLSGPFMDAFTSQRNLLFIGRAVYDRLTRDFIGCTLLTVNVDDFSRVVDLGVGIEGAITHLALVRWDEQGSVVASDGGVEVGGSVSDLDIGVTKENYEGLKEQFSRSYKPGWDPTKWHSTRSGSTYITMFPVPQPPAEYDETYKPDFLIITSVDEDSVVRQVVGLDEEVDDTVWRLISHLLTAGCTGLAVVISVIYVVSLYLTKPLIWMNKVGDEIVNNFGTLNSDSIQYHQSRWVRFSPKTEITDLVDQFQVMIQRFSGNGVAKLVKKKPSEVRNPFTLTPNFESVYTRRSKKEFKYRYDTNRLEQGMDRNIAETPDHVAANCTERVNIGQLVKRTGGGRALAHTLREDLEDACQRKKVTSSPLFWWILGPITVPLLLAMIGISLLVTLDITNELPDIARATEDVYLSFNSNSLLPLAKLRAAYASEIMFAPIRDLHLLTRIAGWLLFGGITRSSAFPTLNMVADSCRQFPANSCPFFEDRNLAVCDCRWEDKWDFECFDYSFDTRPLQRPFLEGLSQDTFPNGDRTNTTFPDVAASPSKTAFWADMSAVPGASHGDNAFGSETTYDRIRAAAALSMIQLPLYNYYEGGGRTRPLGSYLGFEAGGVFEGYAGCYHFPANYSFWQSNSENNAFKINPELCPKGKFGYDPRCRSWYQDGKTAASSAASQLHVTPPYLFASSKFTGTSATLPLVDAATGEHVGQTLVDFSTQQIIESLSPDRTPLTGGFPVVMNVVDDDTSDAIVAPGFDFDGIGAVDVAHIEDFVLAYGEKEGATDSFKSIAEQMRQGGSGSTQFSRLDAQGQEEHFYYAYAPVSVAVYRPINTSDLSMGVEEHQETIFSLGLAESVSAVNSAFDTIEEAMESTTRVAIAIMSMIIAVAFLSVLFISSRVAVSIITPVTQLLALVTKINADEINDEWPSITGGSSEVSRVHLTFERLHMVVRFANTAFYSGDLSKAYATLTEALDLFTKLNNLKAMGVANNNLGNTMLTIYRTMKKTGAPTICGLTKDAVIAKGVAYFKTTIDSGEKALAEINSNEGWSTNYLVFMQQLSNRYFNRAIFLLTVRDDHDDPDEAERQGFTDLSTTKDMDREVVDNGDMQGFKGDVDVYFDLLMCRIRGILLLMEMKYEDEWGIEELFDDAFCELNGALSNPNNGLFRDLAPAGQMQRLDAALIAYYRLSKNCDRTKGAEIAIRMLVEDEYIIGEAGLCAIMALIEYVANLTAADLGGEDPSNVRSTLFQFRRLISDTLSICKYGRDLMHRESFRQSNMGDFSMEIF